MQGGINEERALKSAFIRAHKSFSTLQRLAFWSEADLSANLCGGDPEIGGRQGAPKTYKIALHEATFPISLVAQSSRRDISDSFLITLHNA